MTDACDTVTRREFIGSHRAAGLGLAAGIVPNFAVPDTDRNIRLGLIGLDTSHVIHFTRYINDPAHQTGCTVVAAYPGGSPDIPSSVERIPEYTEQLRNEFGVEINDTIEELCESVDGVLLESVDGRPHLEQARPVIAAGKPLFIDKPMAASLGDVLEIFRLSETSGVPCWSSSSLRFSPGIAGMRNNPEVGDVLGCDAFSPCSLEEHHPDLYWYGVHGVETLFTIMGTGCDRVRRIQLPDEEHVTGIWKDGRIGTFRGRRVGKHTYGAFVYGSKANLPSGGFGGYEPLVDKIVQFVKTGDIPVRKEETIEIFAFMSAADASKRRNGAEVTLAEMLDSTLR
jgi:predicted dehydrogenase